jgi:hypothetical protein
VTASATGLASDATTFSVDTGTKLAFTSSAAAVTSGATKTLTVEIRDANDHLVTSDNSTVVTFAQTSGAGSVTGLGGATASGGIAQKTVTGASAGAVTITATVAGLTSDSSAFAVDPGAADHLKFTSSTADLASGATRSLTVEVDDQQGNRTSSSTAVTLTSASGPGTVTGVPATVHALAGVATLPVAGMAAGPASIQAASTGLGSAVTAFSVVAGSADHLAFTSVASDLASGSSRDLRVEVRDANQNVVTSSAASVTFQKGGGSGTATGVPATVAAAGGAATVTIAGATAGPLEIQASAAGLAGATSSFAILPGVPDHLSFTSATTDLASGAARDLTVEVRDAGENRVDSGARIAFARSSGRGSVTGLPATVAATGGIATTRVTGFRGGLITIGASSAGLRGGSTTFKIAPGPKARKVTLKRSGSSLSGTVSSRAAACRTRVAVRIEQKQKDGAWKAVKWLKTTKTGGFKTRLSKPAIYRAVLTARPRCGGATAVWADRNR